MSQEPSSAHSALSAAPEVSFRPAFLTKKAPPPETAEVVIPQVTSPPRESSSRYGGYSHSSPTKNDGNNSQHPIYVQFRERPTDISARIYTKEFFVKQRPSPTVRPSASVVSAITEAGLWLEDYDSSGVKEEKKQQPETESSTRRPSKTRNPRDNFRSQVQTLLNKLTLDSFKKLSEQIVALLKEATTVELLDDAVVIFHKKVLSDSKFTSMYADLLRIIMKDVAALKDPASGKQVTFRSICLNKCQEVFESSLDPPTPQQIPDEEERDKAIKTSVVNLLFLVELLKINLLPPKLLMGCLETLLAKVKSGLELHSSYGSYQSEINSEKLSKAVILAGESMSQKEQFQFQFLQLVYEIEQLSKFPNLPARNQYLLQDVVDASKNNWVKRRIIEGPQTISDLHTKAYLSSDPLMSPKSPDASAGDATPTKQTSPPVSAPTTPGGAANKRTVVKRVIVESDSNNAKK